MPAKIAASNTLMNVKNADTAPALERVLNVLGSEQKKQTTAPSAAKAIEQRLCAGSGQCQCTKRLWSDAHQTSCSDSEKLLEHEAPRSRVSFELATGLWKAIHT